MPDTPAPRNWQSTRNFNQLECKVAARLLACIYRCLYKQPEERRRRTLHLMVLDEYRLHDEELRQFTLRRFLALLLLDATAAAEIAASYNRAAAKVAGTGAVRHLDAVRSVLSSLEAEKQAEVRRFLPEPLAGPVTDRLCAPVQRAPAHASPRPLLSIPILTEAP